MKSLKNKIFFAVSVTLCVLLFAVRLTGAKWHVVLGVILTCLMVKHTCKRWARLRKQKLALQVVDQMLLISLIVMFVSGMLIHPMHGMLIVKLLHKLSAVVFVLAMVGHVCQHMPAQKRVSRRDTCVEEG